MISGAAALGGDVHHVVVGLRALLALVFLVSAVAKLLDRRASREAVAAFGLPARLVRPIAYALPVVELLAGALLLGPHAESGLGARLTLTLLFAFSVAIGLSLRRGDEVECRCFGALSDKPVGPASLVRNGFLAAAAMTVVFTSDRGPHLARYVGDRSSTEVAVGGLLIGLTAAVLLLARFSWALLRRHGAVLLRLDAVERRLDEVPLALASTRPAPEIALPDLTGEEQSLTALAAAAPSGHLLVVFMAEHCRPCNALLPEVQQWHDDYGSRLPVVAVATGTPYSLKEKFGRAPAYTVLVTANSEEQYAYGVGGTPAAVVVTKGRVVGGPAEGADAIRSLVRGAVATLSQAVDAHAGHVHQIEPRPLAEGDAAPDPVVVDAEGKELRLLESAEGDRVLLFWDVTCGFCSRLQPELDTWLAERNGDAPRLVLVSRNDPGTDPTLPATTVYDRGSVVADLYSAPGTPSAMAVTAQGFVHGRLAVGGPEVMSLLQSFQASPVG
jgi:thiol-disulfide isomerase/thioredoxin/uncharacterized membrane protein YphA (DoxX/SURF4 family)